MTYGHSFSSVPQLFIFFFSFSGTIEHLGNKAPDRRQSQYVRLTPQKVCVSNMQKEKSKGA